MHLNGNRRTAANNVEMDCAKEELANSRVENRREGGEQIKSEKVRRKIFIIYYFQEKKNKKGGKRRGNV